MMTKRMDQNKADLTFAIPDASPRAQHLLDGHRPILKKKYRKAVLEKGEHVMGFTLGTSADIAAKGSSSGTNSTNLVVK